METIAVYCPQKSARLTYVLDWLIKEQLRLSYRLVHDEQEAAILPFFISYGKDYPNALSIPDEGLLWHQGIRKYVLHTGFWQTSMGSLPTLSIISIGAGPYSIPFDLFSAIFFLLSRYEEYDSYVPDKYGRYPATDSIMHKNNWLLRPLADEWVCEFAKLLQDKSNICIVPKPFTYQPTYDIDIAWAYRHKGPLRTINGYIQDLLRGNRANISRRYQVWRGAADPYDNFSFLQQLPSRTKPIYFILAALKTTLYDKNIHPEHPAMQHLVKHLSQEAKVGLHPSFYSDKDDLLKREKTVLERIIEHQITISRQHYIKVKLPITYRALIACGISADYSMGYGTHLGFRAATGRSFQWYDLQQETTTGLRIYPFCFMDTTAYFEEKLSIGTAFEKLNQMKQKLQAANSMLITIFHNFSFGNGGMLPHGWQDAYACFVKETTA